MRVSVISTILFFAFSVGSAQTGNYFLSHYSPDEARSNMVCFDMVQDDRGVFYFATQAGILEFDGRNWDLLPTRGTVYSIAISQTGEIFAAGSRGFGKIIRDDDGLESYTLLREHDTGGHIFHVQAVEDNVYFLGDDKIVELHVETGEIISTLSTPETGPFVSFNEILGQVFVSTEQNGTFRLTDGKLLPASLELGGTLMSSIRHGNQYLLFTNYNRLFVCEAGFKVRELTLQDSTYLNASGIVSASWVDDGLLAIGTLRGGVVFINPVTGKTLEIINYVTGLPDNEVFTLVTDRNLNVWAAHAYGFTRISPYLPFRSFHNYPGLMGNILCATTHNNKVYVGTSLGLYVLEREDFYDEIPYYVNVPVRKQSPAKSSKQQEKPVTESQPTESDKGGLLRFLRRKKAEEKEMPNSSPSATTQQETIASYKRELRTRKILRSSYFSYRKIDGIDAKVSQLMRWNGKLIAAGLSGAYEIAGSRSQQITGSPVRFLYASEIRNRLIASTYDERVVQFEFHGSWEPIDPIEMITEPIHYIFEEGNNSLWLCGFDKVFRISGSGESAFIERLSFSSSNFDRTIGLYLNNEVIIASSNGFFFYNRDSRKLERGDTIRKPLAFFANAENLWFRDLHNWYTAGTSGGHENLQLLNLFSNLRFIDSDPSEEALWIITGNNELLKFNAALVGPPETIFPLILRAIRHEDIVTARNYLKVVQDESAFLVEVVKPDYIGNRFVEYRYLLEGLHQEWSEWSTQNNVIRIPYLPSGDYQLKVQSRDIFGRLSEMEPVSLSITPPYWKQPWFYAAQFSVFLFLVLLSFRLSYRFLIVSRLLSLLSIIIFIEFIQTAAGQTFSQSSPAIDFGIQVFVAMLILPVEGFLRRYFLQAIARRNEARLQESVNEVRKRIGFIAETPELPKPSPRKRSITTSRKKSNK